MFSLLLAAAVTLVLLDTFVFPKAYRMVEAQPATASSAPEDAAATDDTPPADDAAAQGTQDAAEAESAAPEITATSYRDENIEITIETVVAYGTTLYIAEVKLSDPSLLQTALAQGIYGRNIKESTSQIAADNNALLAVNGDYYGFRDTGYVIRNGVLYRDVSSGGQALVIDQNGDFSVVEEDAASAQSLLENGAWQVLSFGPALVVGGEIAVGENEEIAGKSSNSNPRTAIGQIGEGHYLVIVSDGRTSESAGLSLYQLAEQFTARGATVAYNLDGGGSSTMVFVGEVVNVTTNGRSDGERSVSDIVFFGY